MKRKAPKKQAERRVVDTGMWLREITAPEMGPATVETANAMRDEILRDAASTGIPPAIREHAMHVLLAHGVRIESYGRAEFRYPDGWGARPRDDDTYPEVVRDAADLLVKLSLKPTARVAFHVGMRYAIMLTRPFEPDADAGRRSREARETNLQNQTAEANKLRDKFKTAYDTHHVGKVSHTTAVERAADSVGISCRRAWEYCATLGLSAKKTERKSTALPAAPQ